jgi:hypothetical protein
MPGRRFSTEQIIAKLREVERLQVNRYGFSAALMCAPDGAEGSVVGVLVLDGGDQVRAIIAHRWCALTFDLSS